MENKVVSRDDRLNAAFWVCLVFFGAAACWRLFLALEKQLALYAYVDYFIMLGCLVVGAMQKNRWHNRLPACGIVLVCILTQIVNGGWSVNIGGIFMSGQPMLTLRHMADLVYYIALLVTAVFLFLDPRPRVVLFVFGGAFGKPCVHRHDLCFDGGIHGRLQHRLGMVGRKRNARADVFRGDEPACAVPVLLSIRGLHRADAQKAPREA